MQKTLRLIQKQREMSVIAVDVGIYAWSRVEGTKFESEKDHNFMQDLYDKWCITNKKTIKKLKNPRDYPKEFLLSDMAPLAFPYIIPF